MEKISPSPLFFSPYYLAAQRPISGHHSAEIPSPNVNK